MSERAFPTHQISLTAAVEEERATLENLAQLYVYDWSELLHFEIGEGGRFEDFPLAPYWADDWRHPFLLRVGDKLAGFALIEAQSKVTGERGVFDMTEFFVLRRFRRRGVGLAAAFAAFDRFKGRWEVRQREENPAATTFWRRAIGDYTQSKFQEMRWDRPEWTERVQTFST